MRLVSDLLVCLRFFSRFPLPATEREMAPGALAAAAGMTSLAGAIVGFVPAIVLVAATDLGLAALLAAPLAIAALVMATGALHEDGLADCADGFGGGTTRERKLEIMRDSRIGTYGACALALSLYLRAFALGTIATRSLWLGAAAVVLAASLSRATCLLPLMLLPSARSGGLGHAAGKPTPLSLSVSLGLAIVLDSSLLLSGIGLGALVASALSAIIGTLVMTWIAWRQVGGQTGDVVGATQQIAEISILLALAAFS